MLRQIVHAAKQNRSRRDRERDNRCRAHSMRVRRRTRGTMSMRQVEGNGRQQDGISGVREAEKAGRSLGGTASSIASAKTNRNRSPEEVRDVVDARDEHAPVLSRANHRGTTTRLSGERNGSDH